ncbi:MAG: hypothetical protein FD181_1134 [Prolixibacteraceae bacterium]|nr:MAG: hypothetical protein FD181_1134 [Prolixibacteraceae bacterium]
MKKIIFFFLSFALLGAFVRNSFAQTFTVEVQIKNQPNNIILFGSVRGDDFTAIDSASINQSTDRVKFTFPEDAHPGIYRIIFGLSSYAKIMNEPPQQLDFIFDNENLVFNTDFKAPPENLKIIQSKENTVWFGFLEKDKIVRQNIELLEKQIDQYWLKGDTASVIEVANEFNQVQMERDLFVVKTSQENRGLFASQMIKNQRLPLLDGFLTSAERKQSFKKEFFKSLDFTNPALINSSVYTDHIFNYLVSYNNPMFTQKQRETEYIKALDVIVPNIRQNEEVYRFIMGYMVHGFNVLQMENVIGYISKKYNYPQ